MIAALRTLSMSFFCIATFALALSGCASEIAPDPVEVEIETQLKAFVQNLETAPFTADSVLKYRVQVYVSKSHPDVYGSTVCALDSTGKAVFSPYVYKSSEGLVYKDLAADPSYRIDEQEWLSKPLMQGAAVWSEPYFDAGGGEIWMKTLSIPVRRNGVIIAIATTDKRIN